MSVFNPIVNLETPTKLDSIHARRMQHAFAQLFLELIHLEDERVDHILRAYGIAIEPGPVVGIEYPPGAKQVLQNELNLEKALLLRAQEEKPSKPKAKARK